jgi:hypothetical protein
MIKLSKSLAVWGAPDFENTVKAEIQQLRNEELPLQQGLSQSSFVSDTKIKVVILNTIETETSLQVKSSIFYAGIIAGSCCSDDPTPVDEQTEYCEMLFDINKKTAETTVILLNS